MADVSKEPVASLKHSSALNNANVSLLRHFSWILEALKTEAKRSFETPATAQRHMSSFVVSK